MKSFKIREGKVFIDGIHYQSTPCDTVVRGKVGRIQSITIGNRGQFFPIFGEFNDGTPAIKGKKTELVESSDDKPLKKKAGKFTLNPNR